MRHNIRALQVLECVYRHGSVVKAAGELLITPSAISHQLKQLRVQIGEDLYEKSGRSLSFTPRAVRLAQSLSFAFAHIDSSIQQSINDSPSALRIAVCTAFGSGWLNPRIGKYPNIAKASIHVKLHAYQPELSDSVADVFFTTTPIKDGFWTIKLLSEDLVAVAAMSCKRVGNQIPSLITTDLDKENFSEDWLRYAELIKRPDMIELAHFIGASHYLFALELAEHGIGIALVPYFLAERGLERGYLYLWANERLPSGRAYFMNVKHARRNDPAIREFTDWVRSTVNRRL